MPQSHTADQPIHREEETHITNCQMTLKGNKSKATFQQDDCAKLETKYFTTKEGTTTIAPPPPPTHTQLRQR